jgi:hypothetical protein
MATEAGTEAVAPEGSAVDSAAMVSPDCGASIEARFDWAVEYDIKNNTQSVTARTSPTAMLRPMYKAMKLCAGDVVTQGDQVLRGPKESGVEASADFKPTGRKKALRKGRVYCYTVAYDPAFSGSNSVRAGGRTICDGYPSGLGMSVCVGRHFQSGSTDQTACKSVGQLPGAVTTMYTDWISCYNSVYYRSNVYALPIHSSQSLFFIGNGKGCWNG